jgi:hypothetical protein
MGSTSYGMNEVNANFALKDLMGLFVRKKENAIGKLDVYKR